MAYNECMAVKSYLIENEKLMSGWDWDANADLDPRKLTSGSNKRAWWICSKCGHRWQTSIHHRAVRKQDCPKCRYIFKKKIKSNLTITHPKTSQYWLFEKNGLLTPDLFSQHACQKVWWKCPDCGYEWEEKIKNQVKKLVWCPNCKKGIKDLASYAPELIKEWLYSKNTFKPEQTTYSSNKYAWWKCSKCGYEWKAIISNRSVLKRGCPCCSSNVLVVGVNDLNTKFPHIAKEWHPTKNGKLSPKDVIAGSHIKVWWQCPLGHEYQSTVGHRTSSNGTNCPICSSGRQTSFAEQAVFFYVNKLYPDAISRYKADFLGKFELDIYIPSIKYAIEYDGEAWHKENKLERERRKYLLCKKYGITLVRLREQMPELGVDIADYMIGMKNLYKHKNLEFALRQLLIRLNLYKPISNNLINLNRDKHKILEYKKSTVAESLLSVRPDIAMEWHPTKNGNLLPSMFKSGSSHKVWWKCPKCGYEYQTSIAHRTTNYKPTGCPKCGKEKSDLAKGISVNMLSLKTGQILKTFSSISEAGKQLQINSSNIGMVCKGQRKQAGGYGWQYADKAYQDKYNKNKNQLEFVWNSNGGLK
jgi:Zn finger protein HypA/HybF involved in hydrogenase expression/very-short-patch-repair endonuclease